MGQHKHFIYAEFCDRDTRVKLDNLLGRYAGGGFKPFSEEYGVWGTWQSVYQYNGTEKVEGYRYKIKISPRKTPISIEGITKAIDQHIA